MAQIHFLPKKPTSILTDPAAKEQASSSSWGLQQMLALIDL